MKRLCSIIALFLAVIMLSGCSVMDELISMIPGTTEPHLPSRLVVQIDIDVFQKQEGTQRRYTDRDNVEYLVSLLRLLEEGDSPDTDHSAPDDSYTYYTIRTTGANGSTQTYYLLNRRLFKSSDGSWCTVSPLEIAAFEEFITTNYTDCVIESES